MKTISRDFFYYDPLRKTEFCNFSDHEVFSPEEKKEFLLHYSDYLKNDYNLGEESEKACTEEEALQMTALLSAPCTLPMISKRIDIKKIGNYRHHDKIAVYSADFECEIGKKVILTVGSIDPGGRIYVDGNLVFETDKFEEIKIDVTKVLSKGNKHHIEVQVAPRAPEVMFGCTSNDDPYNGRFCDEITLDIINEIEISNPKVLTLTADRGKTTALFSCNTSKPCTVKVYIASFWPEKNKEVLIGGFPSDGNMSAQINLNKVALWCPEDPVLYSVRFEAEDDGKAVDDTVIETGFRTVEQKNGAIYLNGVKTTMKGALMTQYLPPHGETAATHIYLRDWQIVWQYAMLKKMGGNMIRLHILGYGTNDVRFARYADRMGLMLVWTTSDIDRLGQMTLDGVPRCKEGYIEQISLRLNHPSIVIWERPNWNQPTSECVHNIYASAVKSVDNNRLLSLSSCHCCETPHPETDQCICFEESHNENLLGFKFKGDDRRLSEAYQALCMGYSVRRFRIMGSDVIFWCCLMNGTNDAGYLQSPIDNYGYAKYAFYVLRECLDTVTCFNDTTDIKRGVGFKVKPVLFAFPGDTRRVLARVTDEEGNLVDSLDYGEVEVNNYIERLAEWEPAIKTEGYYIVKFEVK